MLEQIKEYFQAYEPDESEPVAAERLNVHRTGVNYRIRFADGSVSDWNLHREDGEITDAYCFDRII